MAKLWEIRENYEPDYRNYEHRGSKDYELHKAFKEGCKHGYKKAMEEFEESDYRRYVTYRDEEDYRGGRGGKY